MNARTITTGLAFSASLLLATSAMAVNASPDTSLGGPNQSSIRAQPDSSFKGRTARVIAQPDSSLGGKSGRVSARPDSSLGGTGAIRYDPATGDDLASGQDSSLFRVMTSRYIPLGYKWLSAALH